MMRAIVAPPAVASAALSELKAWLGITRTADDGELASLMRAAFDVCEGFTGTMPLQSGCEDVLEASSDWQVLSARPVTAITAMAALGTSGLRTALAASDYELDIRADGTGLVRLRRPIDQTRVVVTYVAGLASDWTVLPEAIRHGVVRLAAHQHRARDDEKKAATLPPAVVAALWRPWRRMRLA
ncbi:head-tail connector protein [Novosphingobium jiangmenense]|uniref:Phage gp6-like head-tail connector protein n=1 Tax=Novosphingobium jiangmenense TaxID=2791981 RepID=A0ABS0HDR1_9SPHN|nr:hypothetical protein [Novosphingobium jiangmenense]MBF9150419.1 hypothetical protein [Novosphingobium jiangmenense]